MYVTEQFEKELAVDGLQVDVLKNNITLLAAGSYYVGINLTSLAVSGVTLTL